MVIFGAENLSVTDIVKGLIRFIDMKVVIPTTYPRDKKKSVYTPRFVNIGSVTVILTGKGVLIVLSKFPISIFGYTTHVVNNC